MKERKKERKKERTTNIGDDNDEEMTMMMLTINGFDGKQRQCEDSGSVSARGENGHRT